MRIIKKLTAVIVCIGILCAFVVLGIDFYVKKARKNIFYPPTPLKMTTTAFSFSVAVLTETHRAICLKTDFCRELSFTKTV